MTDLEKLCDATLIDTMPAPLKAAIDAALASGGKPKEIIRRVKRQTGGKRTLTVLAVEAYLSSKH
jgi:hypothetical protein